MQKVKSGYTPKIFSDLFNQREISAYNPKRHPEFRAPLTRTVYYGSESISYLGPKIWDILPGSFKEAVLLKMGVTSMLSVNCVRTAYLEQVLFKAYHKSFSILIIDYLIYLLQWLSWFLPFSNFLYYGIFRSQIVHIHGGRCKNYMVENFVIIIEGFQLFIIITKNCM